MSSIPIRFGRGGLCVWRKVLRCERSERSVWVVWCIVCLEEKKVGGLDVPEWESAFCLPGAA